MKHDTEPRLGWRLQYLQQDPPLCRPPGLPRGRDGFELQQGLASAAKACHPTDEGVIAPQRGTDGDQGR